MKYKRTSSIMLVALMIIMMLPVMVFADTAKYIVVDGVKYNLVGDENLNTQDWVWYWVSSEKTLYLNGYTGGTIGFHGISDPKISAKVNTSSTITNSDKYDENIFFDDNITFVGKGNVTLTKENNKPNLVCNSTGNSYVFFHNEGTIEINTKGCVIESTNDSINVSMWNSGDVNINSEETFGCLFSVNSFSVKGNKKVTFNTTPLIGIYANEVELSGNAKLEFKKALNAIACVTFEAIDDSKLIIDNASTGIIAKNINVGGNANVSIQSEEFTISGFDESEDGITVNIEGTSQVKLISDTNVIGATENSSITLNGEVGNTLSMYSVEDMSVMFDEINKNDINLVKTADDKDYTVTGDPLSSYVKYELEEPVTPPDNPGNPDGGNETPVTPPDNPGNPDGGDETPVTPPDNPGNPDGGDTNPTIPTGDPDELNPGDFVNRCYSVALGREADEEGYNYWWTALTEGTKCGAQVGYGFIFSPEYKETNKSNSDFVKDLYKMYFDREPDEEGYAYWLGMLDDGSADREYVFAGFANSLEFYYLCNKYGVTQGYYVKGMNLDQQSGVNCFVARMYKVCLNRLPDMEGQMGWTLKLINGEVTGTSVAQGFVFSPEFTELGLNDAEYVAYMYRAFFGREGSKDEIDGWITNMTNGTTREEVFRGFAGSVEFDTLCADFGIIR